MGGSGAVTDDPAADDYIIPAGGRSYLSRRLRNEPWNVTATKGYPDLIGLPAAQDRPQSPIPDPNPPS